MPDFQTLEFARPGCLLRSWYRRGTSDQWAIFLHGGCMDHTAFEAQVEAIDPRWNILMPDLRAQGDSTLAPGVPATFNDVIDDLLAVCERLDIRQVHLIGHSLGASVAQEFAWRYPERVRSIILIGCYDHLRRLTWLNWLRVQATVIAVHVTRWGKFCAWCGRVSSREPLVQQYIERCLLKAGRSAYAQLGVSAHNSMHQVSDDVVSHPTLVLRGEGDAPFLLEPITKRILARNPNAREFVIPNAGHATNQDNPTATNTRIKDFLARYQ